MVSTRLRSFRDDETFQKLLESNDYQDYFEIYQLGKKYKKTVETEDINLTDDPEDLSETFENLNNTISNLNNALNEVRNRLENLETDIAKDETTDIKELNQIIDNTLKEISEIAVYAYNSETDHQC